MRKFSTFILVLALLGGALFYVEKQQVEQDQFADEALSSKDRTMKRFVPKINFWHSKNNTKVTFLARLDGYRNSSTPLVMTITRLDVSSNRSETLIYNYDGQNQFSTTLPQGTYEISLIPPLNTDSTSYDTSNTRVIKVENEDKFVLLEYEHIKRPDPSLLADNIDYLKEAKKNVVEKDKTDYDKTYSKYQDVIETFHYLKKSQRDELTKMFIEKKEN